MNKLWLELIGYSVADSTEEHTQTSDFVFLYQDDADKLADEDSFKEYIFFVKCHDVVVLAEVHDVTLRPAVGPFPSIVIGHQMQNL